MKNILFVLQNTYVSRITGPVAEFARSSGYSFIDASLIDDFSFETWDTLVNHPDKIRIPYGSVAWVRNAATSPQFRNVYAFNETFDVNHWIKVFGNDFANYDGWQHTGTDIDFVNPYHIRPLNEDKKVLGKVFEQESWSAHIQDREVPPETIFWVSPVKKIDTEIRCWVINGKVVGSSYYRMSGEPHRSVVTDDAILRTAQGFAERFGTMAPFVMDLALINGEWKFLETNPFYASGWYAIDPDLILAELVRYYVAKESLF